MDRKQFSLLIIITVLASGTDSMSRQQLKNSSKMLKKSCMGKNDVTEDLIGDIEKGKFIEERNVMCYIACIYQMSQIIKNNKLNYEASIKQVDTMFPPDMKVEMKASIEKCKDVWSNEWLEEYLHLRPVNLVQFTDKCSTELAIVTNYIVHNLLAKKYKDLCEASYWTAKCIYEDNPKNFIFA